MKTLLTGGLVATAVAFAAPAFGADLITKAPPAPALAAPSWTGFYLGVEAGGAFAHIETVRTGTVNSPSFPAGGGSSGDGAGAIAGGYIGYNWQFAPNWLVGIEGTFDWSGIRIDTSEASTVNPGVVSSARDRFQWLATAGARLGYVTSANWLLYLKGGAAWTHLDTDSTTVNGAGAVLSTLSGSDTLLGWTVGVGAEMRILGKWTVRGEYNYIDFGTQSLDRTVTFGAGALPTGTVVTRDVSPQIHVFKLGLSYYFN